MMLVKALGIWYIQDTGMTVNSASSQWYPGLWTQTYLQHCCLPGFYFAHASRRLALCLLFFRGSTGVLPTGCHAHVPSRASWFGNTGVSKPAWSLMLLSTAGTNFLKTSFAWVIISVKGLHISQYCLSSLGDCGYMYWSKTISSACSHSWLLGKGWFCICLLILMIFLSRSSTAKQLFIAQLEIGSSKPAAEELSYKTLHVFAKRDFSFAGLWTPARFFHPLGGPTLT